MSAATATVRVARPGDLAAVEALLRASDLPTDGVDAALEDFVVAEDGGALVGVAGLEVRGSSALLRSVAVSSSGRSRGLGRMLVRQVIDAAAARGVRDLYLLTTTAEEYFPRFGFARVDRGEIPGPILATDEFRSVCPSSAVAMHLAIETRR